MLPEAQDQYDKAAKYHLQEANKFFSNKSYGAAFRAAQEYAENAIKATLNKMRTLTKDEKKHNCWVLWEKIKKGGIMSQSEATTLDIYLGDLLKTDISTNTDHINCAPTGNLQTGRLRYVNPDDYISENDAKKKVDLANETWKIFSKYI